MKDQFLAIFFYLLYLLAMVRPLVPVMEYYANYDYIATVLCENKDRPYLECNGKCYLEEQLQTVNHDNHGHNSEAPLIDLRDYPITTVDGEEVNFVGLLGSSDPPIFFKSLITQKAVDRLLRPPQIQI